MRLSDTAGLRETADAVERIGVDRARAEMRGADVVLLVLDGARQLTEEERALLRETEAPLVVALNKADLPPQTDETQARAVLPAGAAVLFTAEP